MNPNAKKMLLSVAFIAVFGIYVLYERSGASNSQPLNTIPAVPTNSLPQNPSASQVPAQNTNPVTMPPSNAGPMMQGKYKNGQYIGSSADAYYGLVQVKVIISGGRLSDIQFLNYPQDNRSSLSRSNYALPQLKTEAIRSQSSNVDSISGATETSRAFNESLSSALSQAI